MILNAIFDYFERQSWVKAIFRFIAITIRKAHSHRGPNYLPITCKFMIIFLVLSILIWKIPHNYASKSNEFVFDIANKE